MFEDLEVKINQNNSQVNTPVNTPNLTPPQPSPTININPDLERKSYIESIKKFETNNVIQGAANSGSKKRFSIKILIILIIIIAIGAGIFLFRAKIFGIVTGAMSQITNKFQKNTEITNPEELIIDDNIGIQDLVIEEEKIVEEPAIIAFLDTDSDGLLDIYESAYGSDINQQDSDNDGYKDGESVINGYSPTNGEKLNDGKNIFYFAYGSNMDFDTMRSRCGEGNFVGFSGSSLNDYVFYFYDRGFANIKESASQTVKGVLYRINENCFNSLDQAEGYPSTYQRRIVKINNSLGDFDAWVYIVENDDSSGDPSQDYFDTVIRGAKQYGVDDFYVQYISSLNAQ